jgi:hypothetical protein
MKQSIKVIVDGVLILAIAALVVQWMTTPSFKANDSSVEIHENVEIQVTEMVIGEDQEPVVQPGQIARLFGWRKREIVNNSELVSTVPAEAVPEGRRPEAIAYLRYIGHAVDSLGEETHFVKNTDTGQVVPLRTNAAHDGWTLIEVSETGIIVERDETLYQILYAMGR